MASYDIKRCPSCNQPYEKNFYSGKPKAEEKIKYGSPIITCASCGHEFLDQDYKEIAIEGVPDMSNYKRFTPGTILYTVLAFAMAFFSYLFEFAFLPAIFLLLGIIIIGSDIFSYSKRLNHLEKEKELSKKRMEDPQYALRLLKYGYKVPETYLPKEENEN